ncbi:hypothetical protein OMR72_003532 [Vibrio parahaemolyticus]|uniref:hypothetical protein n=1 Tax=Vibrio harveyi group TaxID=717610 RepID=UPI0011207402|nr:MULTISPECIES: hypothetical protein [Vibrio harveyi group]ELB2789109.1 hypothetical protein [Vibrio alginolyticus]EGQ7819206.1 hypothetical protein [Vibrio parahaemolyticus]EGQ8705221.1 hypothetical protein [Vibrio parahaemolyticus]EGR3460324.1 hypothetical protein [Vibrio parahaemolyticus]EIJ6617432.1 hypothetical protein [Vibrio parahaemolyticus]
MKMKSILLGFGAISLFGCTSQLYKQTEPINSVTGHEVELVKNVTKLEIDSHERKARLIVARDRGYFASACTSWIYLDGNHIATLAESEFFRAYPSPGEHKLQVVNKKCMAYELELNLTLIAGEQQAYRIMFDGSGLFAEQALIPFQFREYQETLMEK